MSTPPLIEIAQASTADVPTIGGTLARAFYDDPVFEWIVPDAAARRVALPAVFAAFAEAYLVHQETELVADGTGAAVWAPAGVEPLAAEQQESVGELITAVLGADAERAFQVVELLDAHHPDQPCAYLQFIGVVPASQGRGLGSQLLTSKLRRCDASGTPAYLEATSEANRRLYQRHGFDAVTELVLPDGPPLWPMWREPATGEV